MAARVGAATSARSFSRVAVAEANVDGPFCEPREGVRGNVSRKVTRRSAARLSIEAGAVDAQPELAQLTKPRILDFLQPNVAYTSKHDGSHAEEPQGSCRTRTQLAREG